MLKFKVVIFYHFILVINIISAAIQKPNIIFIIADDLGWNDVGFHGLNQIPTPNIDALAYSGLILNNYYVTPICSPSRSSLMTGKYPIHTGMQHSVLYGAEARGLPLGEKLLPQYLKELGYTNHIVGKWHLGSYTRKYLPLNRGFDSHLGYWTGHQDYFDHTAVEKPGFGLDMRRNMNIAYDLHGQYSTDVFTDESVKIINNHNGSNPLFLYLAHAAVHSANPYNPLPAPDKMVEKFDYIQNYDRRKFAAMLSKLDDSVGNVVKALGKTNMLENSIIVFTTDNGGPAAGFNLNAASNYPLRGVKNTLWEGGIRGAACLWSPLLKKNKRVSQQRMHISDWLPTLLEAIGDDISKIKNIDGISIWNDLSNDQVSTRNEILHNIDDIYGNAALTVGQWKLIKGTTYDGQWDFWYGPAGKNSVYYINGVINSEAGKALSSIGKLATINEIKTIRSKAEIQCNNKKQKPCVPNFKPCLFNIEEDPCEYENLADSYPSIIKQLEDTLAQYNSTAVPPGNLPLDSRGDPKYWNYVWTNFGDFDQ